MGSGEGRKGGQGSVRRLRVGVVALLSGSHRCQDGETSGGEPPSSGGIKACEALQGSPGDRGACLRPPAEALIAHGRDSEMVVLGSRALSGTHGFLVGSVAQSVAARSDRPVALVRVPTLPSDASETGFSPIPLAERREVVLGIDRSDNDRLFTVAFQEAAQRGLALRVVHGWRPPGIAAVDSSLMRDERKADLIHAEEKWLDGIIQPWAEKFPEVEVTKDVHPGRPAEYLVRVSPQASLLVVGRREGRHDLVGPRLGHVTHAVMHHAQAPVIVVPEQ